MTSFVQKLLLDSNCHEFAITQDAQKRCCWHCNIWPDWFTSHQETNHIIILQWHTAVYEETFDVNISMAQTMPNSWHFIVGKSSLLKKWQTLAIIQEISFSNLETGRYGQKPGVSQIIQESWQHSLSALLVQIPVQYDTWVLTIQRASSWPSIKVSRIFSFCTPKGTNDSGYRHKDRNNFIPAYAMNYPFQ